MGMGRREKAATPTANREYENTSGLKKKLGFCVPSLPFLIAIYSRESQRNALLSPSRPSVTSSSKNPFFGDSQNA
jgi:hypothetical protein